MRKTICQALTHITWIQTASAFLFSQQKPPEFGHYLLSGLLSSDQNLLYPYTIAEGVPTLLFHPESPNHSKLFPQAITKGPMATWSGIVIQ